MILCKIKVTNLLDNTDVLCSDMYVILVVLQRCLRKIEFFSRIEIMNQFLKCILGELLGCNINSPCFIFVTTHFSF